MGGCCNPSIIDNTPSSATAADSVVAAANDSGKMEHGMCGMASHNHFF